MAGNRESYEQYMNAGHNAAWDQNWQAAIKSYTAAIQEFQEDPDAHIHLGLALLKANRLEDALKVYKRAHQLAPDDPIPLEKSADVLERMGRLKEAAQQYVNVSDVYLSQRDLDKAIGNWERATQLTPGLVAIHAKLAQAYERIGDKHKAIRQYLTLASNFQRVNETAKAIKAVERALRLDKKNPQALNILRALKTGGKVILPDERETLPPKTQQEEKPAFDIFGSMDGQEERKEGDADPRGPMGEAMTEAMGILAGYVVESGVLDSSGTDALQAMEFQRQENYDGAISAYQSAEAGLRHPALKMNLGALLLIKERPEEAVKHLSEAILNPQLASGAYHALGQSYHKLGQHKKAFRNLIQSLQAVDTSLAVNDSEISELMAVYERIIGALEGSNDETLSAINQNFMGLLSGKDWKQRIPDSRRYLEEAMRDQGDKGLKDIIADPRGKEIAEATGRVDQYIRSGLFTLAMDEAHRAVERSPYNLPVHVRMAEIMMHEGRVRQAITKYNTVAKSYMVRGENERAASILSEVLEMAPLDVSVRQSLIDLLVEEQRWAEAVDQYIELAHTFHQLGNFKTAHETYTTAERIAKKENLSAEKMVQIKHQIADLFMVQLDYRNAKIKYEEIIELVPTDEKGLKALVDINFNQGNGVEAIKRLDQLLSAYAKKKDIKRMTQTLEELVKHYPNDTSLRSRLAAIYQQLGRKREAIEQLDALGELQLEAGEHGAARQTIKRIIALKPEHVEDYQKLLGQLGG
jgi:tetratricopeptide (TPR) repeat protein